MSMEDAVDCLRFAQQAADENDHSSTQTGGMRFIGTFLRMLQSGFSPQQHPLLEVILRQKEKALERAKAQVHVRGCWSARGHPEPHGEDASLELKGNEVFLMVPSDGEEIQPWKPCSHFCTPSFVPFHCRETAIIAQKMHTYSTIFWRAFQAHQA